MNDENIIPHQKYGRPKGIKNKRTVARESMLDKTHVDKIISGEIKNPLILLLEWANDITLPMSNRLEAAKEAVKYTDMEMPKRTTNTNLNKNEGAPTVNVAFTKPVDAS